MSLARDSNRIVERRDIGAHTRLEETTSAKEWRDGWRWVVMEEREGRGNRRPLHTKAITLG